MRISARLVTKVATETKKGVGLLRYSRQQTQKARPNVSDSHPRRSVLDGNVNSKSRESLLDGVDFVAVAAKPDRF